MKKQRSAVRAMSGQLVADSENFRRKNERVGMVVIRTSLSSLPINGTVRGEGIRIGLHPFHTILYQRLGPISIVCLLAFFAVLRLEIIYD